MAKDTARDLVWNFVMAAVCRNWEIGIDDVRKEIPTDREISDRTIRDVLNTAAEYHWLEKEKQQSHTWKPTVRRADTIPEGSREPDSSQYQL
jgi:predicted transcriptional regulator